jgi:hypothetical protein
VDRDGNTHQLAHGDQHRAAHSHVVPRRTHTHSATSSDRNEYAECDRHTDTYCYCNANADQHAHANANLGKHSGGYTYLPATTFGDT